MKVSNNLFSLPTKYKQKSPHHAVETKARHVSSSSILSSSNNKKTVHDPTDSEPPTKMIPSSTNFLTSNGKGGTFDSNEMDPSMPRITRLNVDRTGMVVLRPADMITGPTDFDAKTKKTIRSNADRTGEVVPVRSASDPSSMLTRSNDDRTKKMMTTRPTDSDPHTTRSNAVFASNRTIALTIDGNGTNATADRTGKMVPVNTTDGNGKDTARPNTDHTGMIVSRPTDFDPSIALALFDPSTFEPTKMILGSTDFHPPNKKLARPHTDCTGMMLLHPTDDTEMNPSMLLTTRLDSNRTGTVHDKRGTFDSNSPIAPTDDDASGKNILATSSTSTTGGNGETAVPNSTIASTGKSNHNEDDGNDKDDDADDDAGSNKENTNGGAKSHTSAVLSGNTDMMKVTFTDAAAAAAASNQTMVRYSFRRSNKKVSSVLTAVVSTIFISLLLLSDAASALPKQSKSKTPPPPKKKTSKKTSKNTKHSRTPNPPPTPPPPTQPPTTLPTTMSFTYTACLDACPNSGDLCAKQCAALDSCTDDIASAITPYQETWDTVLTGGIDVWTAQMMEFIGTCCCLVIVVDSISTLCWHMYSVYCSSIFDIHGTSVCIKDDYCIVLHSTVAMVADVIVSYNDSHRRHRHRCRCRSRSPLFVGPVLVPKERRRHDVDGIGVGVSLHSSSDQSWFPKSGGRGNVDGIGGALSYISKY